LEGAQPLAAAEDRSTGITPTVELQEIWKKQAWTKKTIEERESKLIDWAKTAWADL
jgi:hypothetical protein